MRSYRWIVFYENTAYCTTIIVRCFWKLCITFPSNGKQRKQKKTIINRLLNYMCMAYGGVTKYIEIMHKCSLFIVDLHGDPRTRKKNWSLENIQVTYKDANIYTFPYLKTSPWHMQYFRPAPRLYVKWSYLELQQLFCVIILKYSF